MDKTEMMDQQESERKEAMLSPQETEETEEKQPEDSVKQKPEAAEDTEDDNEEFEKVCMVCRRPESQAGKMITMPGNLTICQECMQRAFDSFGQGGGMPYGMSFQIPENEDGSMDLSALTGMPGVGVINLAEMCIRDRIWAASIRPRNASKSRT